MESVCLSYPELFYLGLNVTLREVLYVGQLQVHFSQPHQDAVPCRLELLPLADEVLNEQTNNHLLFLKFSSEHVQSLANFTSLSQQSKTVLP